MLGVRPPAGPQAVASALEWPGWCRAGRDERAALEALASYAGRYAPVAARAGVSFPAAAAFDVAERVPGGPVTAFAAPECRRPFPQTTAGAERAAVTPAAARRPGLVTAAWAAFDQIFAASPAGLRTGPRCGGRDRDQIIGHVIGADTAYARKLGIKLKQPATGDIAATGELRQAIAAVIGAPSDGSPVAQATPAAATQPSRRASAGGRWSSHPASAPSTPRANTASRRPGTR